jgi:hypothetical protein
MDSVGISVSHRVAVQTHLPHRAEFIGMIVHTECWSLPSRAEARPPHIELHCRYLQANPLLPYLPCKIRWEWSKIRIAQMLTCTQRG